MITRKDDTWFQNSQQMSILTNGYTYDYAGRLASEVSDDLSTTEYGYDARGNLLSVLKTGFSTSSIYSGDVLTSVTSAINGAAQTVSFVHDALGRMTYDGTTGQAMTYNTLDLIGKVSKGGTVLANYSYLADGTKVSALNGGGEGLVYRGPFVYRRSTGSGTSSLTLESAAFGGGRLTPGGAMLYVTDYLGSVRAVVNGGTGAIYKASDFSAFGAESDAASVQKISAPLGTTFRDAYTGKEDQSQDFGTGYTDFGARQYSPALRRWMAPDPLSEKYYGTSPYAFCANNPVNFVDPDGRYIERGSKKQWRQNKRIIKDNIADLRQSAFNWKNYPEFANVINERIDGIRHTLSTMKILEKSKQGYSLSNASESIGGVTLNTESLIIDIKYISGDIGNFIHEVTHAGQFESGDLGFNFNGGTYAQDIYDEVAAYQAQAYFNGFNHKEITPKFVQSLTDSDGNKIYEPNGSIRTAPISIKIDTPFYKVCKAYGVSIDEYKYILPFYRAKVMYFKPQR